MPITEAEKILNRIRPHLEGKSVMDLGCGRLKIVPWANGVDDGSETTQLEPGTIIAKIDPDSRQLAEHLKYEVVFSSHALEHIRNPIGETLRYWLGFVMQGGRLILSLPDERRYVYDPKNPVARNPGHFHYLTPEVVTWHLQQLPVKIEAVEEDPYVFDRYSFLVIARKK